MSSRFKTVRLTIDVEIIDPTAAIKAARARCQTDGVALSTVRSAADAALYLLDPGASPPGLNILQSTIEKLPDLH
jgi:hypothetical protein